MENNNQNNDYEEKLKQELSKRHKKNFEVNINGKIKDIPDYQVNVNVKKKRKLSVFAKIMFAFMILGISIMLSVSIIFFAQDIYGINKDDMSIVVDIKENSGVSDIAELLQEQGVIKSAFGFKAYYKLSKFDGGLNYGTFSLNSNMSYEMIIEELAKYSKSKDEVKVTIPEGLTIYQIANLLQKNEVCKASEFINVLNTQNFGYEFEDLISKNDKRFHRLEGYVFPETYFFYKNDNPINVANKFLKEFDKRVDQELLDKMKEMGYTLEETLTIASIVQKEAGKTEQMKMVASVYFNRLNNKDVYPNLQACPTRDYANELKKQMDVIDQSIIDAYNTYEDAGLPPGAICNPGLDAINATLNPEESEYFYFCTNLKTGEFYYAKTLKEHERNIVKAGLV